MHLLAQKTAPRPTMANLLPPTLAPATAPPAERVHSALLLEERLRAIDEGAALNDHTLATIQEQSPMSENSSLTGSSRSLPSHKEESEMSPTREGAVCRGCFGGVKQEPPLVDAHDRPLRRDRREIPDDLASLPIREAKERLLEALREDDEPRSAGVMKRAATLAKEALKDHDYKIDPAKQAVGRWRALTRAEFPGAVGKNERGEYEYALGRMSFGLFDPADVVVAVEDCTNIIQQPASKPAVPKALVDARIRARKPPIDASSIKSYDIETRFVVSDRRGAGLRGRLLTKGFCVAAPRGAEAQDAGSRLDVWFVGGSVEPISDDPKQLMRWEALFGSNALPPPPLLKKATRWLLRVGLGIELAPPSKQGFQAYCVAKPMLGFVDVLYADDCIRVTRGNRGSLVVTQHV